jgi:hypothetical protein
MGIELTLPVADHGDLVSALPFFAPALLIVGTIFVMRLTERRRNDSNEES